MKLSKNSWLAISALIFADGIFHLFGFPEIIEKYGPDWILARGLFDTVGLPTSTHRIIGLFLIVTSAYAFYMLGREKDSKFLGFYRKIIAPITLLMVGAALVVKIFGG